MADSGRFEIGERVGRGGFGEVYRAEMVSSGGLKHTVAVKMLDGVAPNDATRLWEEARLLEALDHHAIVRVHDIVSLEERLAMVTEFVPGQDLSECTPLPPSAAVQLVGEVAGALRAAWNKPSANGQRATAKHGCRCASTGELRDCVARTGSVDRLELDTTAFPSGSTRTWWAGRDRGRSGWCKRETDGAGDGPDPTRV